MTEDEKNKIDQEFDYELTITLNPKKVMKMSLEEYRRFRLLLDKAFQIVFKERSGS